MDEKLVHPYYNTFNTISYFGLFEIIKVTHSNAIHEYQWTQKFKAKAQRERKRV